VANGTRMPNIQTCRQGDISKLVISRAKSRRQGQGAKGRSLRVEGQGQWPRRGWGSWVGLASPSTSYGLNDFSVFVH